MVWKSWLRWSEISLRDRPRMNLARAVSRLVPRDAPGAGELSDAKNAAAFARFRVRLLGSYFGAAALLGACAGAIGRPSESVAASAAFRSGLMTGCRA